MTARSAIFLAACFLLLGPPQLLRADDQPAMRALRTPADTRFGLFGEKPSSPAPTLFVFAVGVDDMDRDRIYSETGRLLAVHGWLYVTLDPPCHGEDQAAGEPAGLSGWAHRVKNHQQLIEPFTRRCTDVLDFLIAEGYTDPHCIAACGTSRGGFCALQFAAAEPRVRAVACISPVTNLLSLSEFAGLTPDQVSALNVEHQAESLAGRPIWLSIGNQDTRVGTDDCIATARRLVAAARARRPDAPKIPVELLVGASEGHHAIDDAYALAAAFIQASTAQPPPPTPGRSIPN